MLLQVVQGNQKVNICDLARELEESKGQESDVKNIKWKSFQEILRMINNGKGTSSWIKGEQILTQYVKTKCCCLKNHALP